ncbi:AlpA family phage regulatory protein [Shinella sp. WSJ-2]|uniref:helix-turn-helix transcriptional regulator n=1 Tax=Shinella sp. WSJ-2 TaxID=2303749 RepID=UPI000E3D6C03|nr:AlpA family phage regulatory protein [Shinella sp. WSJ-2]RFZ81998.1 AlpA family phage regulatory protein [Shinella sp. WSJ-2]
MTEVCETTSLSRAMINKLRAAGRFPLAVSITERRIVFVRSEVEAWLDQRISARTAA